MGDDWVDVWLGRVIVTVLLVCMVGVGVAVYEAVAQTRVERACLALGYPGGSYRWVGPSYCVKRVDETDVVLPLPGGEV